MAIARAQVHCDKCGKPYKALHRDMGRHFVGDTFVSWDYEGHQCDKTTAQYNKWLAEQEKLEAYRNSPEGKKKQGEFQAMLESKPQAKLYQPSAPEQTDMDKLNEFLRGIADQNNVGIRRKILAIKRYIEAFTNHINK